MPIEWGKAIKKPIEVNYREPKGGYELIKTPSGTVVARKGKHFVMKDVEGGLYPILKSIFYTTYDVIVKCGI